MSEKSMISLRYLICSVYTLLGSDQFFKQMNFKDPTYLSKKNINYFLSDEKKIYEFYSLIKRPALKKFAFKRIQFFLNSNRIIQPKVKINVAFLTTENRNKFCYEFTLFTKYLKKFHYNYRHYFIYQNSDCITSPTDAEIGANAVKALLLILGI